VGPDLQEAGSADAETVERERRRIRELVSKYGYELHNIFNMDESGLFYGHVLPSVPSHTPLILIQPTGCLQIKD
jgi:hypothetical protein